VRGRVLVLDGDGLAHLHLKRGWVVLEVLDIDRLTRGLRLGRGVRRNADSREGEPQDSDESDGEVRKSAHSAPLFPNDRFHHVISSTDTERGGTAKNCLSGQIQVSR